MVRCSKIKNKTMGLFIYRNLCGPYRNIVYVVKNCATNVFLKTSTHMHLHICICTCLYIYIYIYIYISIICAHARTHVYIIKLQSKCNQTRPQCNENKIKCKHNTIKMQSKCSQNSIKCNQDAIRRNQHTIGIRSCTSTIQTKYPQNCINMRWKNKLQSKPFHGVRRAAKQKASRNPGAKDNLIAFDRIWIHADCITFVFDCMLTVCCLHVGCS